MIVLPSCPVPNDYEPMLRHWGGVLTPFLGGPEQLVNRVGTRWGVRCVMPPMLSDEGRLFISRLAQAKTDMLRMAWPLLDFDPGLPGAPKVASATSGGMALPLKGMTAGYQGREGQFFSIVHGGRRYVHMLTADFTASGGGTATAAIFPMLRVALSVDDVVEIAAPMIEGLVLPGDELSWRIGLSSHAEIAFTVMEAA